MSYETTPTTEKDGSLSHPIVITTFADLAAREKVEVEVPWADLPSFLMEPSASSKKGLPLMVAGTFDGSRTSKGALRHIDGLEKISALMVDYDQGQVSMEQGAALFRTAGIDAVLAPTASWSPEFPKWRAVVRLAHTYPAKGHQLKFLLRRWFDFLGKSGIQAAGESTTLSQGFYFGHVQGREVPAPIVVSTGVAIDSRVGHIEVQDLDTQADDLSWAKGQGEEQGRTPRMSAERLQELMRAIMAGGEGLHDNLRAVAMSMASRGSDVDMIRACLQAAMMVCRDGSDRWTARYEEIDRLAESAVRKIRTSRREGHFGQDDDDSPNPFNPEKARAGLARNDAPDFMPFLVEGLFPIDVGVLNATGGTGKSTIIQWICNQVALGREVFGKKVVRDNPKILVISNEDGRDRWGIRQRELCAAGHYTQEELDILDSNVFFEDLSGHDTRLVLPTAGDDMEFSPLLRQLIQAYKPIGVDMVILDPLVGFGPGERFVNDGMQMLINACRRLQKTLNAFVLLIHHVNKFQGQSGQVSQHSGRGGTALGDGVRLELQLSVHRERVDGGHNPMPIAITEDMLDGQGTAYALHVHKITDAPLPRDPLWLYRNGWAFEHVELEAEADRMEARAEADEAHREYTLGQGLRAITTFVDDNPHLIVTRRNLRDFLGDINGIAETRISQRDLARIVDEGVGLGLLFEVEHSPPGHRGRKPLRLVHSRPEEG